MNFNMNKKFFTFFLLCIFFHSYGSAQTDQSLIYSSYFGGSGTEEVRYNVLDARVNYWISGCYSSSNNIPVTDNAFQSSSNGGLDVFLSIFQDFNTLKYASFFGGTGNDIIQSVRFMPGINGFVIAGYTLSTDFPVTSEANLEEHQGGGEDGFISRFSEDGELLWSTYFGGSGMDRIEDIAVDNSNSVYVAGRTYSSGLGTPGVYQPEIIGANAFLAKLDSDGVLMWFTYFGDTGAENFRSVDISPDGASVYCGGYANSDQNIAHNGWQNTHGGTGDALLTSFNSIDGTLNWSTYYGGAQNDECAAIVVAPNGAVYIAGRTLSDFNIASVGAHKEIFTGYSDNFLVRFSPEGNREWGTYFGGNGTENILVNLNVQDGNIIMNGITNSQDNIVFGNPFDGGSSVTSSYMAKFNPSGEVIWGSYFISDPPIIILAFESIPGSAKMVAVGGVWEGVNMSEFITSDAYQENNAGEDDLIYFVFGDNTLSAKTNNLNPLKVYPNPATDMVTIVRPENLTGDLNLEIFDAMGKLVLRKSFTTWSVGINVSKLTAGAYILKINTEKEIYRTELILE